MKSILRATAILGGGTLVSILARLISTKILAVLLGPGGIGFLGLLQNLLQLATLVAGLGIGTGLVRAGANALAREDRAHVAALERAAWLLTLALGVLGVLLLVIFRAPLGRLMLGGTEEAGNVLLIGVALLFSLAATVETSLLNAHHRVGALAKANLLYNVLGAATTVALVAIWGERAVAPAVVLGAGINWGATRRLRRREIRPTGLTVRREELTGAGRSLLRFGVPYTASMVVGTGVTLALPSIILHLLGEESVGFYRAAAEISIGYLGFLLVAMGQDYYPRVSAASDDPAALVGLINQQHRLIMILAIPLIFGTLALAPLLVPLIYTPSFDPTVAILEWQLIGDLFKFSAWTMSYVILARSGGATFFGIELVGGATTVAASWLGMRWFGLAGIGAAFLVTTVVYYLVCRQILHRQIGLTWTMENKVLLLAAALAALIIRGLPLAGLGEARTAVALGFALIAGGGSAYVLWAEMGGWHGARRALGSR